MASKAPISCSIVVESKSSAVVGVCKEVLAKLEEYNFDKDDIFAVHLTFEEAFLNAVKHGNKNDPTKKVKIDYSVTPEKVEITITDEGDGGLLLMNSYMDTVKYNEQGNSVYMVRFKEKPSLSGDQSQTEV
jgi:serine/threonine-protein kinase RsbW